MAKKKPERCKCIDEADKQCREKYGATFKRSLFIDFKTGKSGLSGPQLALEWLNGKPKGSKALPTCECAFCPFCGKEQP